MGDAKVGKSSILNRFINNSFEVWFDYFKNPQHLDFDKICFLKAKYCPTVEDLHSCDFQIGEYKLNVDFLDTSGDDQVKS